MLLMRPHDAVLSEHPHGLSRVFAVLFVCVSMGQSGCVHIETASRRLQSTEPPSYFYLSPDSKLSPGILTPLPASTVDPTPPIVSSGQCEMTSDVDRTTGNVFPELPSSMWIDLHNDPDEDVDKLLFIKQLRELNSIAEWAIIKPGNKRLLRLNTARTTCNFLISHQNLSPAQRSAILKPCTDLESSANVYMLPQLLSGEIRITLRSWCLRKVDLSDRLDYPALKPILINFEWDEKNEQLVSRQDWAIARVHQPLKLDVEGFICNVGPDGRCIRVMADATACQ